MAFINRHYHLEMDFILEERGARDGGNTIALRNPSWEAAEKSSLGKSGPRLHLLPLIPTPLSAPSCLWDPSGFPEMASDSAASQFYLSPHKGQYRYLSGPSAPGQEDPSGQKRNKRESQR